MVNLEVASERRADDCRIPTSRLETRGLRGCPPVGRLDRTVTDGRAHKRGAIRDRVPTHELREMLLDGLLADGEARSDLLVRAARRDEFEDHILPPRKRTWLRPGLVRRLQEREELPACGIA